MPGTPAVSKQEKAPFGDSPPSYFYFLKTGTGVYEAGYFELPVEINDPRPVRSLLDGIREQMLSPGNPLKILSEREFKIEEREAREWLIKDGDKIVRERWFIYGNRFYRITLTVSRKIAFKTGKPSGSLTDRTDFYETTSAKFFDSLKLLPVSDVAAASGGDQPVARQGIITGGILTGRAISKPAPYYPPAAKSAGAQGLVEVEITVDEKGKVIEARAISGHPLLRDEAVKAARRARFSPTKLPDGTAVKVKGTISYNFIAH